MTPQNRLLNVISEAQDWISAQDAFTRAGLTSDSTTSDIEALYVELRELIKGELVEIEPVRDGGQRKLFDRLRLARRSSHAPR